MHTIQHQSKLVVSASMARAHGGDTGGSRPVAGIVAKKATVSSRRTHHKKPQHAKICNEDRGNEIN